MDNSTKSSIILKDRGRIEISGVESVGSFDEGFVVLTTSLGEVNIEGEGLKIEDLSSERGEILILGKINAFFYKDKILKRRKGRE